MLPLLGQGSGLPACAARAVELSRPRKRQRAVHTHTGGVASSKRARMLPLPRGPAVHAAFAAAGVCGDTGTEGMPRMCCIGQLRTVRSGGVGVWLRAVVGQWVQAVRRDTGQSAAAACPTQWPLPRAREVAGRTEWELPPACGACKHCHVCLIAEYLSCAGVHVAAVDLLGRYGRLRVLSQCRLSLCL